MSDRRSELFADAVGCLTILAVLALLVFMPVLCG